MSTGALLGLMGFHGSFVALLARWDELAAHCPVRLGDMAVLKFIVEELLLAGVVMFGGRE